LVGALDPILVSLVGLAMLVLVVYYLRRRGRCAACGLDDAPADHPPVAAKVLRPVPS
jgi:hypothetical protein